MRIKELIKLLQQLPEEWDFLVAFPDKADLVFEYTLGHPDDVKDFVYLPSEESGMLDSVVLDHLQLMKHQGVDLADYLRDREVDEATGEIDYLDMAWENFWDEKKGDSES